jgi:hypothetical protein
MSARERGWDDAETDGVVVSSLGLHKHQVTSKRTHTPAQLVARVATQEDEFA